MPIRSARSNSIYVSHAVVKLEAIGANNETLSWASGFIIEERDFLSLYTCWHVVSGVDPHNLPAQQPTRRERLRIHTLAQAQRTPEISVIGGLHSFEIELFDQAGNPAWSQGDPQEGMEGGATPPPNWDCIRIDVSPHREAFPGCFQPEDDILHALDISQDAFIVGYPYGYSPLETGPYPVFLRRTPATSMGPRFVTLLDGPGAKGMSGGPVVTRVNNEWRLAGIYNGVLFPEAQNFFDELERNQFRSSLPLGKYTVLMIARGVVGVSAENRSVKAHKGA